MQQKFSGTFLIPFELFLALVVVNVMRRFPLDARPHSQSVFSLDDQSKRHVN